MPTTTRGRDLGGVVIGLDYVRGIADLRVFDGDRTLGDIELPVTEGLRMGHRMRVRVAWDFEVRKDGDDG